MESLGEYLKKARKKKKLSLEKVASQTRIQEHHLQALESEDFSNLPAKVFAKGFVRSYAKVLGLNEEEALQCFLETSNTFYNQSQPEEGQPHVQVKLEAAPGQGINWNLTIIALILIAAGVFWYWLPEQQETPLTIVEPEKSSPVETAQEPTLSALDSKESLPTELPTDSLPSPPSPQTSPELPKPSPKVTTAIETPLPTPVVPATSTPQTTEVPVHTPHTLEIEATQLTWVVVKSDLEDPSEALLQPGQRSTWKATQQFVVTLGNAAGVTIRLNGEVQGPFGKPGQVVRDIRLRP